MMPQRPTAGPAWVSVTVLSTVLTARSAVAFFVFASTLIPFRAVCVCVCVCREHQKSVLSVTTTLTPKMRAPKSSQALATLNGNVRSSAGPSKGSREVGVTVLRGVLTRAAAAASLLSPSPRSTRRADHKNVHFKVCRPSHKHNTPSRAQEGERDTDDSENSTAVPRIVRPSGMHQYEVLQTLGVGKHGEVKKAIHRLSGCPVSD